MLGDYWTNENALPALGRIVDVPVKLGGYPLTEIGYNVFAGCSNLKSINIPNSIVKIESGAFNDCYNVESVTIPQCVERVNCYFPNPGAIKHVAFAPGVVSIGEYALDGMCDLETVEIPSTVIAIERRAFADCQSLQSISLPESLCWIGEEAFAYCGSIRTLSIPGSVSAFAERAFRDMRSLRAVRLGNGVRRIAEGAFENCQELRSVSLPSSLEEIGEYAFSGCSNLQHISLPDGLFWVERFAFQCCPIKSLTVPGSLTYVDECAFDGLSSLEKLVLEEGVEYLDDYAFGNTGCLLSLMLPSSLKYIGTNALPLSGNATVLVAPGDVNRMRNMLGLYMDISRLLIVDDDAFESVLAVAMSQGAGEVYLAAGEPLPEIELRSGVVVIALGETRDVTALRSKITPVPTEDGQEASCFHVTSWVGGGGICLSVELDDEVVAADRTLAQAVSDGMLQTLASAASNIAYIQLDDVRPGLYYGLSVASTPAALRETKPGAMVKATASGVRLPVKKLQGDSAFYRLVVSD